MTLHPVALLSIALIASVPGLWWMAQRVSARLAMHRRVARLPSLASADRFGKFTGRQGVFGASLGFAERTSKVLRSEPRTVVIRNLIKESGLTWTRTGLLLRMSVLVVIITIALMFRGLSVAVSLPVGLVVSPILLWLYAKRAHRKRLKAFEAEFAGALDTVIRGLGSGLPLLECFSAVSTSAKEPLRSEFQRVVDAHSIGTSLPAAIDQLAERISLTEVRLFSLIIAIQQQTGGSLVEALSNLADTLRERWELAAKVRISSQEARASGMIVGAMPFVVAAGLYIINPDYLLPLVETGAGLTVLVISGLWMLLGILIMWRMVNFDV